MQLLRVSKKQLKEYVVLMVNSQKGKCAVCGEPFTARDGHVVDHCHFTGRLRGAIHRSCNGAEGAVLTMATRIDRNDEGVRYLVKLGDRVANGVALSRHDLKILSMARRCHSGVSPRVFIVGLAKYYVLYAAPKHNLIHPSHHLEFERHEGIPKEKRNWR